MNTDTTDKVLDALKPIAEKLSTTVDLLMAKYAVYIRVEAASNVAIGVVLFAAALALGVYLTKRGNAAEDGDSQSGFFVFAFAFFAAATAAFIVTLFNARDLALSIASPEIVLLKEVVKGLK